MEPTALQGHMMPESAVDDLLREQGVGVLSLARDGTPYGLPMSFGYADDGLYFLFVGHSERGRKVRYAEATDEASFLVFDVAAASAWRSAVVSGPLERITPERWDDARAAMADNAYRPDLLTDADVRENPRVWVLDVAEKTGRRMDGD